MTEEELARGLAALGYRVEDEEMRQLAEQVGPGGPGTGGVRKSAFVASQLDWPALQSDFRCAPPAPGTTPSGPGPIHPCVTRHSLFAADDMPGCMDIGAWSGVVCGLPHADM